VKGYLLDTNHVGAWQRKQPGFMARLAATDPSHLPRVCTITMGELEFGNRVTSTTDQIRRDEFNTFVVRELAPFALNLTVNTSRYYGQVLDRIWRDRPPNPHQRTDAHLVSLGVDINDVWLMALAWEHGLVLLTQDAMTVLRKNVPEVSIECWI
jgi:predicted nucleic acid-binding protein